MRRDDGGLRQEMRRDAVHGEMKAMSSFRAGAVHGHN